MKKFILAILSLVLAASLHAQKPEDLVVKVPEVPAEFTNFNERCDYMVVEFWKPFDPKNAFSNLDKMQRSLEFFMDFAPYASATKVHEGINTLLTKMQKAKPEHMLALAGMAEQLCYTDTAEYRSEELYFPFVEAVATNKKVKGAEKARFAAQYEQLRNSRLGAVVDDFTFTQADGTQMSLYEVSAPNVMLMFYDPECIDCRIAKTRLSADDVLNQLIANGVIAVVAIYPGEADAAFLAEAPSMPDNWIIGAAPDIDRKFTMDIQPEIYYLNHKHVVRVKDMGVDGTLRVFRSFVQ